MARTDLWSFRWAEHRCVAEIPSSLGVDPRVWLPGFEPERISAEGEAAPPARLVIGEADDDPASTLEHGVVLHLLSGDRGRTHLHGAAAELPDGGAVVVLGPSGSGKSTLARAFGEMGLAIFGDDVLVLDDDGLLPFPRLLKFEGVVGDQLMDPSAAGGWGRPGTSIRAVFRLDFEEGAGLDVARCPPAEALRLLTGSLHATGAPAEASLDRLLHLATTTPVAKGVRGEASETARRLIARIGITCGD